MDPFAAGGPVDVARRDLGLGEEGHAAVAEIGQADGVPGRHIGRFLAVDFLPQIVGDGRDHALDHEAGFGHADRHRGRADRRNRDTDAQRIDIGEGRIALVLVGQDEASRIDQPLDPTHGFDAPEGRQHHGIDERQGVGRLDRSVLVDRLDVHRPRLDPGHLGAGNPFDVPVAHLALQQAAGIADTVQPEVADIRFGPAPCDAAAQCRGSGRTHRPAQSRTRPAPPRR